jgi:hypothetical protein
MLPIAVLGCTLTIVGLTPGTATITTIPSLKATITNKGIYKGTVSVLVAGCTQGAYTQTSPMSGDFIITAIKTKVENDFVLRSLDITSPITIPLQKTVTPFDSISVPITVIVTDAGQTKVTTN